MKQSIWLLCFLLFPTVVILPGLVYSETSSPVTFQVTPADVKWVPMKTFPAGAKVALIYSSPGKNEHYVLLVKFPPNYRVLSHAHPIEQISTVISGTLYSGLGEKFEPEKLKILPAGSVYNEPVNMYHYGKTKAEEVILQVTGVGPGGTLYANPSDAPRKN